MAKKTKNSSKVKKDVVKSSKVKQKKKTKKVSQKKKSPKKQIKKKPAKKKNRKRSRRKRLSMEEIYKIINKVQISGEKEIFAVDVDDSFMVENVLIDAALVVDKQMMKTQTVFTVSPSDETDMDIIERLEIEYLEDEIPEDGQIF